MRFLPREIKLERRPQFSQSPELEYGSPSLSFASNRLYVLASCSTHGIERFRPFALPRNTYSL